MKMEEILINSVLKIIDWSIKQIEMPIYDMTWCGDEFKI